MALKLMLGNFQVELDAGKVNVKDVEGKLEVNAVVPEEYRKPACQFLDGAILALQEVRRNIDLEDKKGEERG